MSGLAFSGREVNQTGNCFDGTISVVVPVKNEVQNIAPLLAEIHDALTGLREFEVVYIDDGSDDNTAAALATARARYPRLRVIRHQRSCGQSTALRTGIEAARFPWIATLDGDGQNDPRDIPLLLEALILAGEKGRHTLIAGQRQRRHDPWLRRVSSRVANGVRASLLGDCTPDTGCGLKAFSRDLFLSLPFFDHMHRFLPALAMRQGGEIVRVGVRHRPRHAGRSNYGVHNRLWVGLVDLFGVLWLQHRMQHPIIIVEDSSHDHP
jgi:dolichol-phosphate mannosyltransferase